ncbi:DUF4362 domain-containing protein [Paenibacillus sp. R14(2021)]|uniref:DUF4362 domain-containing protein n=1 Tax=Paenibacillus sp. R14(2021) TaxID=2859228 RepID=UPI001C612E6B|nr:DUF4362 domain-containing protein [Paenibacillus sp. R14(2021)]
MKKKILLPFLLAAVLLSGCQRSAFGSGGAEGFPIPTKPYTVEQAIQNGDVVNDHGTYRNLGKWRQFLTAVKKHRFKHEQVRITEYSLEGAPIFSELTYDGQRIHFTYDNAMDPLGTNLGRPSAVCAGVDLKSQNDGPKTYLLTGCDTQIGQYFQFYEEPED